MRGKYGQLWDAIKSANMLIFGLGLAAFLLACMVASVRLKLIVDSQSPVGVSFFEAASLTLIGYFFNNFLPSSVGGDVAKAFYLSKKNKSKLNSFACVFVDRAMGLITMIFMAAIALLFAEQQIVDKDVKYAIYGITAFSLILVLFLINRNFARKFSGLLRFIRPLEEKLKKAYDALHIYKNHTGLIVKSFAISIVSQVLFFISIGILALSIGSRIPALDVLLRMPIICAASLIPSINGLGVREGSTVIFFGPVIGKTNAFAVSILWLAVLFIVSILGGLIYAFSPQFKMKWGELSSKGAL